MNQLTPFWTTFSNKSPISERKMKTPTKIMLVGAGGIGCNLAPILSRNHDLVIVDGDIYEPKNVTRQFPALLHAGNKAEVLAGMVDIHTLQNVWHIPEYLKNGMITNHENWSGTDFLVTGVDNNESRRICIALAEEMEIPCILAGNSHEHGEAHLFIPGIHNPLEHFPFSMEEEQSPWACNTDEVIEEFPQTPVANFLAAGCAMHLLLSWAKVQNPRNCIVYSRSDALSSTFKRAKEFVPEQEALTT